MIASLRFAGDLHPVVVIGFALMAALSVAWLYLRETRAVDSPLSFLLPGLRAAAVALAVLILAGPVWHRRQTIGTLGHVTFAVDQSASMSATDSIAGDSNSTRLARASRLLIGSDSKTGWLDRLRSTHDIDVVAFSARDTVNVWSSGEQSQLPLSLDLEADGRSTDLSAAIETLGDSNGNKAAIVLLTDGRHTDKTSPVDSAANVEALGVKVHAIGIGSVDEPGDIGITRVVHPDTTAADAPLVGQILVHQYSFTGHESKVSIQHQGETVWQKTVTLDDTETAIPFEIDIVPLVEQVSTSAPRGVERRIAVMDFKASIQPPDGDSRHQNNSRSFRVAASTSEHRLLILDGSSRWEMRYIKNLFARDPEWAVETLLVGPGTDTASLERGDELGKFPSSAEAIARYDAIILGEFPAEQWTQADGSLLREFVSRGGGLIVIDGRYGQVKSLVQNSLSDLVPIKFTAGQPITVQSILPTPASQNHPAFELWEDKSKQIEFWEQLPAPPVAPDIEPQAGSEVLANAVAPGGFTTPWMVTRLFGAGRVVYLSTDQTWRWRYKVADRFHSKFWNQLMISVIQPPYSAGDNFVALGTDKIEYRDGETATVRARLRSATGQPIGDSTVEAILVRQNEIVMRIPLEIDDPARGTYRGTSAPLDLGKYSVRIRASGIAQQALQATTPIWVEESETGELSRVSLHLPLLRQIAESGGGAFFHESEADSIIDQLEPLSSGQIVESDIHLWQSFYWFVIIMLMMTVEWLLRKRAGLI